MEPGVGQLQLFSTEEIGERVKKALLSGELPVLYANGFIIFLGQADIGLILQTNGRETHVLNISYTTAKTLVEQLGNTIRNFEEKTGQSIMTTSFIQKKMVVGGQNEPN